MTYRREFRVACLTGVGDARASGRWTGSGKKPRLTIPEGTELAYKAAGWNEFFIIPGIAEFTYVYDNYSKATITGYEGPTTGELVIKPYMIGDGLQAGVIIPAGIFDECNFSKITFMSGSYYVNSRAFANCTDIQEVQCFNVYFSEMATDAFPSETRPKLYFTRDYVQTYANSAWISSFDFQVSAMPEFVVADSRFTDQLEVIISHPNSEATIYYTDNDLWPIDYPESNCKVYEGPITITNPTRFHAYAVEPGKNPSDIASREYICDLKVGSEFTEMDTRYRVLSVEPIERTDGGTPYAGSVATLGPVSDHMAPHMNVETSVYYDGKNYLVKEVGADAFVGCNNLKTATSTTAEPCQWTSGPWTGSGEKPILTVPAGTRNAYISAGWGEYFDFPVTPFNLRLTSAGHSFVLEGLTGETRVGFEPVDGQTISSVSLNGEEISHEVGYITIPASTEGEALVQVVTEENEVTGIGDVEAGGQIKVTLAFNEVTISGAEADDVATLADVKGRVIYQGYDRTLTVGAPGVYILRVGQKTFKFAI